MPRITPLPMPAERLPQVTPFEVDSDPITKVMTIEEANALIEKLKTERRETNTKLRDALATIEQMTSRPGSLVRAYCEKPAQFYLSGPLSVRAMSGRSAQVSSTRRSAAQLNSKPFRCSGSALSPVHHVLRAVGDGLNVAGGAAHSIARRKRERSAHKRDRYQFASHQGSPHL